MFLCHFRSTRNFKEPKTDEKFWCFTVELLLSPFHFKSYDTYDIERHTIKTLSLQWRGAAPVLISRGQ